ncbi:sugar ABC transporter ATP-binding protein [bacterium M00.F.Ca.ET.228.01.1.1]|uniref:sugar ABC transporter ATP-binding protein n=1 Tax=Paraburkholderia phenoliruptrix TaxID=252970 RepID=UPI001092D871|nr:sugar ABC transporter ATP-binding protein [Paraburkholderia phenoliruptrix]TGP41628.1 sugar ABC transporter ATP-binding protein [bacterium M00.F.Ca.ET.228.01.1.1]TGR98419.1 sugar ABC transporter ATP-binding protein [bacterium M00.F.Ca.ET.191.01.1.1]TGU02753.1 sugar ABC transporter ATP-binding protein [bacterium M00.F.Ca.ET.155.01.1.1]MBW0447577.1 sugar ABC transporter ATP-binding protein [Paraburkholderia phenoliruptrix]MBW9098220.1 sugar ABC transporter ATP-binding protein [Paraburkholderi
MTPLISVSKLSKSFPGVRALHNVQFELMAGEVHALMGENGAGKSTLMKILAGVYSRDSGDILLNGKPVHFSSPRDAQAVGVGIIHQELQLMNHLTVAQNIFIGREPRGRLGVFLDEDRLNAQARDILSRMQVKLDPRAMVGDLTVASQQMVEIAKALSFDSRVLIMDEPTSALNDAEIAELFRIIRELKARGVGIVYISHKMDELKQIADRVTVLRDGEYVATVDAANTTVQAIIGMMVGRTLSDAAPAVHAAAQGETALEVRNLNAGPLVRDVSFAVRQGEILGFAGLMGAGRTEVARAVFGADPVESGEIFVKGARASIRHPRDAVAHGIGYLSEDRKRFGLATSMDVESNIVMSNLRHFLSCSFFLRRARMRRRANHFINLLAIRTPSAAQEVRLLSGGNQQKIVIAKWLERNCDVLFFDEPTRGIDVGAKSEIYKLLRALADEGKAIVMISSELPEILRMSNRIVVMCEGRITGELSAAEATQERIMHLATQRPTLKAA